MGPVNYAVISIKPLLEVIHHAKYALISVLNVVIPPLAPNAALILSLLLMDLALNADMVSTRSTTSPAKPVSLTALIVRIITPASTALLDSVLTELITAGHATFLIASYVNLQISVSLVSSPIISITSLILVIANILINC